MTESQDARSAQRRVERIHAFQEQLEELLQGGVISLTAEQRERLDAHLARSLAELAERYDVDISASQKQISLGMRILSTLGGLALCAALILFFYRFWGVMTTAARIAVLAGAPVIGLVAMDIVARREKTRYFTGLVGLIVLGSFILNLTVLGGLFNVLPSQNALLAWGLFALALAYIYRLRLPLAAGLIFLLAFAAATITVWTGGWCLDFLRRPETILPLGFLIAAVPLAVRHKQVPDFPDVYRAVGLFFGLFSLELLVHAGRVSFIPLGVTAVENLYRILGFLLAGLVIWLGIRHSHTSMVNLGSLFFAVYIFDRLFSSWWNWMPKYLFFLIIGLTAVVLLIVFRKLRSGTRRVHA